jgi:hypothetical protein
MWTRDQATDILSDIRYVREKLTELYKIAPDARIEEADRIAAGVEVDLLVYLEQLEKTEEIGKVQEVKE